MRSVPRPESPVSSPPSVATTTLLPCPPPSLLRAIGQLAIGMLFATVPHLFFRIERHGLERLTPEPSTYYAISHKRDPDAFVPLPLTLGQLGWRALTG
ncbi:MAG: hypothetical protein ABI068_00730 [Ktedonobacterales bacterium]